MITMAQQPEDVLRMSAKPITPKVDPHATLTVPIGPPPMMRIPDHPSHLSTIAPEKMPDMSIEPDLSDLPISMSAGSAPDVSTGMAAPKVNSPASLPGIQARTEDRLMADYKKDSDPYGSPNNHPGFFGKFLHGLNVATGGVNRRQFEEQGLENHLADLSKIESAEGLQGAQAENQNAQAKKAGEPENTLVPTSGGYETFNPHEGSPTLHPLATTNGQPAMPYVKPGPRQHVFLQGPAGQAIAATFEPQSGTYFDAHDQPIQNPQPYEKPPAETPHAIQVNGKPGFGIVVPGKGWVDPTTGQAITGHVTPIPPPPSYGQLILPTKTATFIGQDGIPREYQWNEKTQTYDKPLGTSASNAYGHEAAQAGAVERAGENVIADLNANRKSLGTLGAWVMKHGLNTPIADPTLQGIQAELASFAALNPAMHGARGTEAMKHFEQLIGGLQQNPDATIAGIRAIMKTAGAINPNVNATPKGGSSTPPPEGADVKVKGADGKMYWGNSKTKQILGPVQ